MLNRRVWVRKLGEQHPEDIRGDVQYVPLPEYGIALWLFPEPTMESNN